MGIRVLVIGGGGREHALCWKLAQSPTVDAVLSAPGNPGMATLGETFPIALADHASMVALAEQQRIDLVVIGPEDPLAAGLADRLTDAGFAVVGHSAAASRIESSKAWAKEIMSEAGVPAARSVAVATRAQGAQAITELGGNGPVVVKVDGLTAGKGVVVAQDRDEATEALFTFIDQVSGRPDEAATPTVVIEEFLEGQEVSVLALVDSTTVRTLAPSCDYKRAFDGDAGPNTGGMGVYTPTQAVDAGLLAEIERTVLEPTARVMVERGHPLRGVLYAGLILTSAGPKVLEFNARFGDPETQVVLPTLESDLAELLTAVASGRLTMTPKPASSGAAVGVVLASPGYPGSYPKGLPITGVDALHDEPDVTVFHAGTALDDQGQLVTAGGRVLTVVGRGDDLAAAHATAYAAAERIQFEGQMMRRDIAVRELPSFDSNALP